MRALLEGAARRRGGCGASCPLSPLRGGGAEFASVLRLELALRAGRISAMKMAGPLHPPFSLFLPEEKETAPAGACRRPTAAKRRLLGRRQTGRARSKREKEVIWPSIGRTLRNADSWVGACTFLVGPDPLVRPFPWGGLLVLAGWTVLPSSLPLTWW